MSGSRDNRRDTATRGHHHIIKFLVWDSCFTLSNFLDIERAEMENMDLHCGSAGLTQGPDHHINGCRCGIILARR